MAITSPLVLLWCCLIVIALGSSYLGGTEGASHYIAPLNRSTFPDGFVFRAGSAAYQLFGLTEGASHYIAPLNRSTFPDGFVFGAGSAAYQVAFTLVSLARADFQIFLPNAGPFLGVEH